MSKDFVSAAIMKKKKLEEKAKSAASPFESKSNKVEMELEGTIETPKKEFKDTIKKPKSEDVMSIDLMLNSAKKKKPEGEVEMGPTEVEGKSYGSSGSEKYLKALKKYKRG